MSTQPSQTPLKCGILICGGSVQLLDIAAVDILGMITPEYMRACKLPDALVSNAKEIEFVYIIDKVKGEGDMPRFTGTTAGMTIYANEALDTIGNLDFLFVPGPDPSIETNAETKAFIQQVLPSLRNLLVVCTGIIPIAQSGVLSGKRVTAPLPLVSVLQGVVPDAEWTKKRWEVDHEGKIWTSGGISNGIDMMIAFVKEKFGAELAGLVCMLSDIQERAQDYPKEQLEMKYT